MPELPEVETVRTVLEGQITEQTIVEVAVRRNVIAHPDVEAFRSGLTGQRIRAVGRRGKFLQLFMESGHTVVIHLRMTGCLMVFPAREEPEQHTHVVFRFADGQELHYRDPRRFGRLWLLNPGEEDIWTGMARLGPEPFDPGLTAERLMLRCGKRKRTIRDCLLDQSIVAGIGNIYSGEILFRARIHPARPARTLTAEEWDRLARTIPECLSFFIEKNRVTPEEYRESRGEDYRNTPFLQVYGHGGGPCPVCGAPLRKQTIGGRSSVFCGRCQPPMEDWI